MKIGNASVISPSLQQNSTIGQIISSYLEVFLFGLSLYVPYMLCGERVIEPYNATTLADLMIYDKRSQEMKEFLDHICGSAVLGILA